MKKELKDAELNTDLMRFHKENLVDALIYNGLKQRLAVYGLKQDWILPTDFIVGFLGSLEQRVKGETWVNNVDTFNLVLDQVADVIGAFAALLKETNPQISDAEVTQHCVELLGHINLASYNRIQAQDANIRLTK